MQEDTLQGASTISLESRKAYSESRLAEVRRMLEEIDELKKARQLCIYITGSYGRLEAGKQSDLDIFFIHEGTGRHHALSTIQQTLINAEIIKGCRRLGFPEFSGGGRYLEIHYLDDMLKVLGSPEDDFKNYFTARMLMLLESRPLHNEQLYPDILRKVIHSYYRDYTGHESDFRPVFMINDIVRYWKTLCLNYEMRRNDPSEDPKTRADHQLKNIKLKFSRLLTCFSLVIAIAEQPAGLGEEDVLALVQQAPLERIGRFSQIPEYNELLDDYAWFLERTGRPKPECIAWMEAREAREQALARAREFGKRLFQMLKHVVNDGDTFRYIVM